MVRKVILGLIFALAIFLRVWNLGNVPPSPSLDEASIGYNAYSVIKTGGDEYGSFPLISQRGYDDWRRSTYLMLVIPSVGLFGLNAVAVRLPSVILSILTVISSYYIATLLFKNKTRFSDTVCLLVPFLLAISPWHIYISRLGHESNACLSFLVFGVLFFLMGEKKKKFFLIFTSLIFFILSTISYYSGQVFIPLFLISLFMIYRKNLIEILLSDKKNFIYLGLLSALAVLIFLNIFSPTSLIRFQGTSTFTQAAHPDLFNSMVLKRNIAVSNKDIIGAVINNRRLYPIEVLIQGYFSHLNPWWLFTNSGHEAFKIPNMGLLYIWEGPLVLLGMIILLLNKEMRLGSKILVFVWFFLGPLPASIATQAPHAMRSYNFLPTWQIFTAYGVSYLFTRLYRFRIGLLVSFLSLVFVSMISLYNNYFVVFPRTQSDSFQYALKDVIPYINQNKNMYKKIIVSNENNLFQSYMFYLFYSKYDPQKYQDEGGTISGGFAEHHKIEKIEFRPINWKKDSLLEDALVVGNPKDFPSGINFAQKFYLLNGQEAVEAVKL